MSLFRTKYPSYDEITRIVRAWAEANPSFVRLESLATSPEGRELWLLTIGRDPDRTRPAAWVDANMHASELAGSCVALAIAEDLITAHASGAPIHDLPPHLAAILRDDILVYVLPRMCPDGAEQILRTGAYVRSNPRDGRLGRTAPYWNAGDVDGDGRARLMRREDPAGEFVCSPTIPGLMLPRRLEDPGPYYSLYPEGMIENWDGFTVPVDNFLSNSETDMNRNFPYDWAPEPKQIGAGAFATSEPESRAVTVFATQHPNIFAWLNLHCYGGCYIRPAGDMPDRKMDQRDLNLYLQIGEWAEAYAGYPMVSGFEEFTYEPDKPLRGDLSTFAYVQRGTVAMVCELWDFWKQAGLTVHRPFVLNYSRRTRDDIEAIGRWDRDKNGGRVVGAWRPFVHPQLGPVEVGGYDPRIGVWNPPEEQIATLCEGQAKVFFRIAALTPRVRVAEVTVTPVGSGVSRITAIVQNDGFLPTYVLSSARELPWSDPLRARLVLGGDVTVVGTDNEQVVGHLEGWGSCERSATPSFARSVSAPVRQRLSWVVKGKGSVTVQASSARTGRVETTVEITG
ncbi:Hypothetical protein A7982_03774 [Minicystis rosea]|nr:Hypothetical protein A7982_03774 [Minicystis rosea]